MYQNRQRTTVKSLTAAVSLAILFPLTATAVPLSVLQGPDSVISNMQRPTNTKSRASGDNQSRSAGSEAFYFCEVDTVQIGTFGGSDCWGWEAPDGTEYAIMGTADGISFVDAAAATHLFTVDGPLNSCGGVRWRDMATWGQYCYAVSECTGNRAGLMVIDMSYLPDSAHYIGSVPIDQSSHVTSHNLSIDSLTGYIYLEGTSDPGQSIQVFSLADPAAPTHVNSLGIGGGIHDLYARNDTLYVAEGANPSFSIYDMADKMNPDLLARVTVPNPGYVHNIWPSDDGSHIVTTEETPGKTIKYWNINNLNSIYLQGEYLAPSGLAHNAQMSGDTIFASHYESGIAVVDATDPSNLTELARYDTFESETSGYGGAWGVFQYTNSGRIYASNGDGRLFIIQRHDGVIDATVIGDSIATDPGEQIRFDVELSSASAVSWGLLPIGWSGPYDLILDSISRDGLVSETFDEFNLVDLDSANERAALYFKVSSVDETEAVDLESPTAIASLYFTISPDAWGGPNFIRFNSYGIYERQLNSYGCNTFEPTATVGKVLLGIHCCVFNRGNVNNDFEDKVNVSDLTFLVEYLFSATAGQEPVCNEEANVNGDPEEKVNITDVTHLTDYLFGVPNGPGPATCP